MDTVQRLLCCVYVTSWLDWSLGVLGKQLFHSLLVLVLAVYQTVTVQTGMDRGVQSAQLCWLLFLFVKLR